MKSPRRFPSARRTLLGVWLLFAAGCGPLTFTVGGPIDQDLQRKTVRPAQHLTFNRIAIIDVSGLIYNANKPQLFAPGDNPVALLDEALTAASRDARVKAVILRLNSPGGTVTASDIMYRRVLAFRLQTQKPVVALLADVAASGGYYVACASDRIVAHPTSVTGSVGVLLQTLSLKPALGRIGIETDAITSGPNKDAGSPLSTLSPQQRAILQRMVDDFYARFVQVLRQGRPGIPDDRLKEATDGRVMSGSEAVAWGLADEAGDLDTAVAVAQRLAGIDDANLVMYHRPLVYVGSPHAASALAPASAAWGGPGTQINLAQINLPDTLSGLSVGFYYLWDPGAGTW